jgi:DNA-nicking Smr family endonuclease
MSGEFDHLFRIEQDECQRPVFLDAPTLKFKVAAPTADAMLLERITGESAADVQKAEHSARSLQVAETLSRATDIPELEKAAGVFGTTIEQEMVKVLHKAVAEFTTEVGAIPNKRPVTTPASRSPKSAARRAKLRALFPEAGIDLSGYNQEAVERLIDSMEALLDSVLS